MNDQFDKLLDDEATAKDQLALARALLNPKKVRDPVWPALLAAAFFAVCALGFAVGAILAPPAEFTPVKTDRP